MGEGTVQTGVFDHMGLPPPWGGDPLSTIRTDLGNRHIVVLDDDPTGTQTVRDVPVLTEWGQDALRTSVTGPDAITFVLTNSRSLRPPDAVQIARDIGRRLAQVVADVGKPVTVISRSDSTLRGHFPEEVDALARGFGIADARIVLAPFFGAGGRVTIDDVHYVLKNGVLIPVARTEFARDPVFGYRSSNLRDWVKERLTSGPRPISSLSLQTSRKQGPIGIRDELLGTPPGCVCIANAVDERDIEVAAAGLMLAENEGLPVIVRSAASFVRARAGQPVHQCLSGPDLGVSGPGLVVFGSHVQASTSQLEALLNAPDLDARSFELGSDVALPDRRPAELVRIAREVDRALERGHTAVLYTDRRFRPRRTPTENLRVAGSFSDALVSVVRAVSVRPFWVLTKGGITSSDIATEALGVRLARVLGQLLPGVSVWRTSPGSRWPGLVLVIFPGNVGGPPDVRDAVRQLVGSMQ